MRLLVDCTMTSRQPDLMTGIQRATHEIVAHCRQSDSRDIQCLPVIFSHGNWRILNGDIPRSPLLARLRKSAAKGRQQRGVARLKVSRGEWVAILPWVMGRVRYTASTLLVSIYKRISSFNRVKGLRLEPGDILLLLDTASVRPEVQSAQASGISIHVLIHDIIPITHPEYFAGENDMVVQWFDWSIAHAKRIHITSIYVQSTLQAHYGASCPDFRLFCLGDNLPPVELSKPRAALAKALGPHSILMVGTIEPRKGYICALDAFDFCWEKGLDVHLTIIGRIGWMTDALINRIQTHPELNKRLHVFYDATDGELVYAYQHGRILLAASTVEGFGLPLVEAARYGMPVLASDIPVFREVTKNQAEYFAVNDPQALAHALVAEYARKVRRVPSREHITWAESARQLMKAATQ